MLRRGNTSGFQKDARRQPSLFRLTDLNTIDSFQPPSAWYLDIVALESNTYSLDQNDLVFAYNSQGQKEQICGGVERPNRGEKRVWVSHSNLRTPGL